MGVTYDLVVIGGGINGAGVARDAAGRGLSVLLCERDDLAQHTSSASTKLIHGGLRYLEQYDFRLVRHSLLEREVLLRNAPHIIWPLRFVLPHHAELRPRWLIRTGLFIYDHIGGRRDLPASRSVDLCTHVAGEPLKPEYRRGFEYSDCWVQDSRLVVLNARDASLRGADVRTRTECTGLERGVGFWEVALQDRRTGVTEMVKSRAVVNATGPWVKATCDLDQRTPAVHGVRLIKGSHIVVPQLFDHPYPYIFQNADQRVLFAIPYEGKYTLLGTTDVEIGTQPGKAKVEAHEVEYICAAISEYFKVAVTSEDVVWSYTGVRPLFDDAAESASRVTRDYVIHLDENGPPIVSIYGGKITTYRKLSEEVLRMLEKPLAIDSPSWTATAPLPGGDLKGRTFDEFLASVAQRYPWLPEEIRYDYARNYGTEIETLLRNRDANTGLGTHFGGPLHQAEVNYLVSHEWAETAEDVLWRRTRKGLHVPPKTQETLDRWLADTSRLGDSARRRGG